MLERIIVELSDIAFGQVEGCQCAYLNHRRIWLNNIRITR